MGEKFTLWSCAYYRETHSVHLSNLSIFLIGCLTGMKYSSVKCSWLSILRVQAVCLQQ